MGLGQQNFDAAILAVRRKRMALVQWAAIGESLHRRPRLVDFVTSQQILHDRRGTRGGKSQFEVYLLFRTGSESV